MDLSDSDNPLAVEIQQEQAAAYFGACKKMVDALEALKAFDQAFVPSTLGYEKTKRRSELLEDAAERVFFVLIQREAIKLSAYEEFFDNYEISKEVRARLGPRKRT